VEEELGSDTVMDVVLEAVAVHIAARLFAPDVPKLACCVHVSDPPVGVLKVTAPSSPPATTMRRSPAVTLNEAVERVVLVAPVADQFAVGVAFAGVDATNVGAAIYVRR
jgi:hypothetical protein